MFTTIQDIQQYLSPIILDVAIAQIPFEIPAPKCDALAIRLDGSVYTLIQIDTQRNMQLTLDEQIVWETNAKLTQPIEQYCVATTIYNNDEHIIQALVAAIDKEILKEIQSYCQQKNLRISTITSADKQFAFYTARLPIHKLPELLKKINQVLILSIVCLTICCSSILIWNFSTLDKRQQQTANIETQLHQVEQTYAAQQVVAAQKQHLIRNKQQLTSILRFLDQLKLTPATIILDEVTFSPDKTISIKGSTRNTPDIERFGKILQKYSRKTTLLSSNRIADKTAFEYIVPGIQPKIKGKNNGDY